MNQFIIREARIVVVGRAFRLLRRCPTSPELEVPTKHFNGPQSLATTNGLVGMRTVRFEQRCPSVETNFPQRGEDRLGANLGVFDARFVSFVDKARNLIISQHPTRARSSRVPPSRVPGGDVSRGGAFARDHAFSEFELLEGNHRLFCTRHGCFKPTCARAGAAFVLHVSRQCPLRPVGYGSTTCRGGPAKGAAGSTHGPQTPSAGRTGSCQWNLPLVFESLRRSPTAGGGTTPSAPRDNRSDL